MTNEDIVLQILGDKYDELKGICKTLCKKNKEKYSDDIFNDTVIQLYKITKKKGKLDDMTDKGIMRYFVRSYINNLRMQTRYAYIKKRDTNITKEEFNERYDQTHTSKQDKIIRDLLEDFSILFIMKMVELNFTPESFYLYRLKTLGKKTYKQIHDETKIPKSRDKILEVNNWVKQNISREIIQKEFNDIYGDLIEK